MLDQNMKLNFSMRAKELNFSSLEKLSEIAI